MALYQNGILISGANTLPKMTLAEYQALPVSERPTYWERTDLNYSSLPASDVTYDNTDTDLSSTNVQDAIDELAKPTFTEAETRTNIVSGESFSTILGKIKKFFTDLKTVAFTGAYSDLSGTENVAYKNTNNRFSQSQIIDAKNGTASTEGYSYVSVGNGTPSGTDGNSYGIVEIYSKGSNYVDLKAGNLTANRNIELPDKNGTIAITDDLGNLVTYDHSQLGTAKNGATVNTNGQYTYAHKNNNVVVLNLRIAIPIINDVTPVYTLSSDVKPRYSNGYILATNLWDSTIFGTFSIGGTGEIIATANCSGKDLTLRVVYIH